MAKRRGSLKTSYSQLPEQDMLVHSGSSDGPQQPRNAAHHARFPAGMLHLLSHVEAMNRCLRVPDGLMLFPCQVSAALCSE